MQPLLDMGGLDMSESESVNEVAERRKPGMMDRALATVAPRLALQRMISRDALHEFAAVKRGSASGRPTTVYELLVMRRSPVSSRLLMRPSSRRRMWVRREVVTGRLRQLAPACRLG